LALLPIAGGPGGVTQLSQGCFIKICKGQKMPRTTPPSPALGMERRSDDGGCPLRELLSLWLLRLASAQSMKELKYHYCGQASSRHCYRRRGHVWGGFFFFLSLFLSFGQPLYILTPSRFGLPTCRYTLHVNAYPPLCQVPSNIMSLQKI
jgi:hypothetical protein